MENLKGILINPFDRTIKKIEIDNSDLLNSLYQCIDCSTIEKITLDENNDLIFDEEFCFSNNQAFFTIMFENNTEGQIIGGKAVILGIDDENWIDCFFNKLNKYEIGFFSDETNLRISNI